METRKSYRVTVFGAHGFSGSIYAGYFVAGNVDEAAEKARFYYCAALNAPCMVEFVDDLGVPLRRGEPLDLTDREAA